MTSEELDNEIRRVVGAELADAVAQVTREAVEAEQDACLLVSEQSAETHHHLKVLARNERDHGSAAMHAEAEGACRRISASIRERKEN